MDSCIPFTGHGAYLQVEGDNTTIIPIRKHPSSHRTHSLSCSSSVGSSSSFESSSFDESLSSSSITPLRFSGIPFSWEQHPGIPKKYHSPSSKNILPLPPPPPNPTSCKRFDLEPIFTTQKKNNQENYHKDPFVAAFMECSRDRRGLKNCWKESSKVSRTRTLSDRFGFIGLYASCKNSCAVSDSTVSIPRSSRGSFLLNSRRHF
ncbi:uncharacterized protein LOC122058709 [Macadamia integrifolia]|uniref:uncharacterized protein LOC122058709 n=1 Tax=Macadamia integrifolia TaxID=60698 RepID=UPI001C52B410|nr:uncharacterized protein LOC122058709 [Macadamia integrifolia]